MDALTTALEVAILCLTAFSSIALFVLTCVDAATERKSLGRKLNPAVAVKPTSGVVSMAAHRAQRIAVFGAEPESRAA